MRDSNIRMVIGKVIHRKSDTISLLQGSTCGVVAYLIRPRWVSQSDFDTILRGLKLDLPPEGLEITRKWEARRGGRSGEDEKN